jgi:hypothetical protein
MTDEKRRVAILLRGPQCTGKTATAQILLAGKKPISLDDRNYDQLRASDEVLVIELGFGESDGMPPGPTREPAQWQRILANEKRELYAFFLTADRSVREERAKKERYRNVSVATLDFSDAVHRRPEVVSFAETAGITEVTIDTNCKSESEVAETIREIVAKDHPELRWPSTH